MDEQKNTYFANAITDPLLAACIGPPEYKPPKPPKPPKSPKPTRQPKTRKQPEKRRPGPPPRFQFPAVPYPRGGIRTDIPGDAWPPESDTPGTPGDPLEAAGEARESGTCTYQEKDVATQAVTVDGAEAMPEDTDEDRPGTARTTDPSRTAGTDDDPPVDHDVTDDRPGTDTDDTQGDPDVPPASDQVHATALPGEIDRARFERYARAGATLREITASFGSTRRKMEKWIAETYGDGATFTDVATFFRSIGAAELRAAQLDAALAGDKTMLIWLGKNLLDQADEPQKWRQNDAVEARLGSVLDTIRDAITMPSPGASNSVQGPACGRGDPGGEAADKPATGPGEDPDDDTPGGDDHAAGRDD